MIETKFKVLMHCGIYVDANLLEKGIYETSKPTLYSYETIEDLIEKWQEFQKLFGGDFPNKKVLKSLKQCQLVDVELLIN